MIPFNFPARTVAENRVRYAESSMPNYSISTIETPPGRRLVPELVPELLRLISPRISCVLTCNSDPNMAAKAGIWNLKKYSWNALIAPFRTHSNKIPISNPSPTQASTPKDWRDKINRWTIHHNNTCFTHSSGFFLRITSLLSNYKLYYATKMVGRCDYCRRKAGGYCTEMIIKPSTHHQASAPLIIHQVLHSSSNAPLVIKQLHSSFIKCFTHHPTNKLEAKPVRSEHSCWY